MIKLMLSPHFRLRHYAGGIAVILLLVGIYFAALYAVFSAGGSSLGNNEWRDGYVRHLIWFSFWQAGLSALLSVGIGIVFARALSAVYRQAMVAENLFLNLCITCIGCSFWFNWSLWLIRLASEADGLA